MDSITHIVLGAVIGEVIAGRRLGKKALLLGAFAQSLPDIDFVASFWLDTSRDVLAHRGFTHSFLFVLLAAFLLALLVRRWSWGRLLSLRSWLFFFGLELFVHVFIDAFNAYGTGWFEPFSHYRVSFGSLFVADPFFSMWPALSLLVLLMLKRGRRSRKYWAGGGILLSCIYLLYAILNKQRIDTRVERQFRQDQLSYTRYFTTPTPLNSFLWFVVAEVPGGFQTGYASVFDRDDAIPFHFFPKGDSLLVPFRDRQDVRNLVRFAKGYYTVEHWHDTLVLNDLYFGQIRGWEMPDARFVFHYYLQDPGNNKVIVQRGRFEGWDRRAVMAFIRRIEGHTGVSGE
ncbi:MAG: metal-dependent hydrolase [Puia sp.]|nr:metal-dependent hydrolase [Puia sp.]